MKILCYGDSNTHGYNPQDFFGGTYPRHSRWPEILQDTYGYETINKGMNGRELPDSEWQFDYLGKDLKAFHPDVLLIMLSTNDILHNVTDEQLDEKFNKLCVWLNQNCKDITPVLIVPVRCVAYGTASEGRCDAAADILLENAEKYGINTVHADQWNIPLAYDGIHFTAEGHRDFAEHMSEYLKRSEC